MIPIEIQCSCGQKFAFDVEPVDGQMPNAVACTECGCDLTEASNEQIRQQLAAVAPPAPVEENNTWMVVILCVAVLVLLGLAVGGYFFFNSETKTTPQTVASASKVQPVPEPSSVPATLSIPAAPVPSASSLPATSSAPEAPVAPAATAQSKAAKSERDPSYVAVGILFDRNLKTGRLEIKKVFPKSPAKKAKIVAGDIILKVDDKPIQELPLKEIADMVYGPVGSTITMELLQSATGKTKLITMVRKQYPR